MASSTSAAFLPSAKYANEFGRTVVLGANRGLGLAVTSALAAAGVAVTGTCRGPSATGALNDLGVDVVGGIDFLDDEAPQRLVEGLGDAVIDTLFIVAGYFTQETLASPNRAEERKMFEICAIAPVMIVTALQAAKKFSARCRIGFITSEGGSIGLRSEKEGGESYGHHMSKCAANMAGRLLSWDLKKFGVSMIMIHPGFLKTEMTQDKYAHLYEELGAVEAAEAVPYILQVVVDLTPETTGRFVAAMGKAGLGLGVWALEDPDALVPGGDLPW